MEDTQCPPLASMYAKVMHAYICICAHMAHTQRKRGEERRKGGKEGKRKAGREGEVEGGRGKTRLSSLAVDIVLLRNHM